MDNSTFCMGNMGRNLAHSTRNTRLCTDDEVSCRDGTCRHTVIREKREFNITRQNYCESWGFGRTWRPIPQGVKFNFRTIARIKKA
jgi:hypothetical protein